MIYDLFKTLLKQQKKIPEDYKDSVIEHVVKVHESVGVFSKMFLQKLRRVNYVTPKNYLDFIKTYVRLLEEKDKFVLDQVWKARFGFDRKFFVHLW